MKTVGIYVGSFNPFHVGHLNILQKAQDIFDDVIVGQGWNPEKSKPVKVDVAGFERRLNGSRFYQYDGLTTDFFRDISLQYFIDSKIKTQVQLTLIRGTRSGHDYEQEITNWKIMEDLLGAKLPIVFIPCDKEFEHVSSSMIRQLQKIDPELAKKYLV